MIENIFKKIPKPISGFFVLLIITIIPVFGHLNDLPIQIWDEARLAGNAYEMSKSGNLIVTSWNHSPDMWNTKPPFLIWLQAFFIKLIGPSELAIRIPIAIAAFSTCFFLYWIAVKKFNSYLFGIVIAMILVTTQGYIMLHGARTGDYDVMVSLFITLYCFCFFFFVEEHKPKNLLFTFLFLTLAVLTKSVAGLFATPALFIYALARKRVWTILKTKQFYVGLSFFIVVVAGYYLLREHLNPGYIKSVQENELGGRFANTIENHPGDGWFYFDQELDFRFKYWAWFIPCGILCGLMAKDALLKRLTLFSTLVAAVYFTVISSAQTKLSWYDLPIYPFYAVIVGVFIYTLLQLLKSIPMRQQITRVNVFPYLLLFLLFLQPYKEILSIVMSPKSDEGNANNDRLALYLKTLITHDEEQNYTAANEYVISNDLFGGHIMWYANLLRRPNQSIDGVDLKSLKKGQKFITSSIKERDYVDSAYNVSCLYSWKGVDVLLIQ